MKNIGINFHFMRKEEKHTQRKIVNDFKNCKFDELN
jgi:hypothetical protein